MTLYNIRAESGDELTLAVSASFQVATCDDCMTQVWSVTADLSERPRRCLRGHRRTVNSAVFSPNGQQVVTASHDCTARVWSVFTGECLHTMLGHECPVFTAFFSPDGTRVLTASTDGMTKLWTVGAGVGSQGVCLRTLWGKNAAVFSPDSHAVLTVLSAPNDNTAHLSTVVSGVCLCVLQGHECPISSTVFSPDGEILLTASDDKTARIWSAFSGECLRTLCGNANEIRSAVFFSGGPPWDVLTASLDGTVKLWYGFAPNCSVCGDCFHALQTSQSGEVVVLLTVLSPDEEVILTCLSNGTCSLWCTATGELLHTLQEGSAYFSQHTLHMRCPIESAEFSPDSQEVLIALYGMKVKLWSVVSGECECTLPGSFASFAPVASVRVDPRAFIDEHTRLRWLRSDGTSAPPLETNGLEACEGPLREGQEEQWVCAGCNAVRPRSSYSSSVWARRKQRPARCCWCPPRGRGKRS